MAERSCLSVAVACALQLWIPDPTSAQAAPSFEELVASNVLQPGERIEVRDAAGNTVKGEFQEFRAGTLVLFSGSGFERAFTATDVRRIRRAGGNAVAWGAIAGASIAALATAGAASAYGRNEGGGFCKGWCCRHGSDPMGTATFFATDANEKGGSPHPKRWLSPSGPGVTTTPP